MWSDPTVTRFIGGKPCTEQQTWARILGYIGHWALQGYGYWAIEESSSRRFVGELGFADFRRDISASMKGAPELGFVLAADVHGRGYATEAAQAAVAWADSHVSSVRTTCLINPDNLASIRIVSELGYREFERTSFNDRPTIFFERPQRDHRS